MTSKITDAKTTFEPIGPIVARVVAKVAGKIAKPEKSAANG